MRGEQGKFYHEKKRSTQFVREARPEDIERLVEIDLECFADVYDSHPTSPQEIHSMLLKRQGIAKELMIVGEVDGIIEGFMTCQRTNITAETLRTWEETTNNGTLIGTHNPSGRNFYVVNLTVTRKGSEHGLSDQLIAKLYGKFLEIQGEKAYLLSRIPQFSQWLEDQSINFEGLDPNTQDALVNEYLNITKMVNGKRRFYDGMLERYAAVGARPIRALRDGFIDPASKNYSVLCVVENPLPTRVKKSRTGSLLAGKAIGLASKHPSILRKL